jgi:hypothetical protein
MAMFSLEGRTDALLPRRRFLGRLGRAALAALILTLLALGCGMVGYIYFEGMSSIDAFANAAMILSGMGPLAPLATAGGKLFAGIYAIFSGFFAITMAGLLLTPIAHRVLHRFHVEDDDPPGW